MIQEIKIWVVLPERGSRKDPKKGFKKNDSFDLCNFTMSIYLPNITNKINEIYYNVSLREIFCYLCL
jgi:hypothetical protein